jgi:hypothetical protein
MFRRVILFVVLLAILVTLIVIKVYPTASDHNRNSNDAVEYNTQEYKITNIKGDQYYGIGDNGAQINFSAEKIVSDHKIQVNDMVICYFEKNDLGKGLVKVEKK